ncbi:glycosyltransferase [Clostridium sartagoforme]|uniref:Glycosyltransferase n=1 Tax=Clostridium sartagoforme TaxID=84031 RepID=A0A4S2DKH9_9CLOT|nr:glycosyltransferase family 4 protein [Clostridium sartagoforme]TGY41473.1 glycosyltransferase [Clostridium sartagoforme]
MKICFLGDAGSIHTRRWIEYFRDTGNEVHLISFRNADISGIKFYYMGDSINIDSDGGNKAYLKKVPKIRSIIKEINPDLINAHYLTSYGFIGSLVKGKIPLVVSTWGTDILVTPKKNKAYKLLTEYVLKKCDLVTSDSDYMSEEIVNLKADKNKVLTVPMGVSLSDIDYKNVSESRDNMFLSMRTLCENSNVECILDAFKIVLEKYSDSKLIITNSGSSEKSILNYINELGIENNVDFRGFINREELFDLLNKGLSFISIPTSDSTSVTLLESMISGSFPIVSDLPANREWIEDEVNGLILKGFNSKELSELMIRTIEDKSLVRKAQDTNREIIKERAIWEDNMQIVLDAYRNL